MTVQLLQVPKRTLLAVVLTAIVAAGLVVLIQLLQLDRALAFGFTFDLLLTVPLLYLWLIRKTHIPRITAVPLGMVMLLLASWFIPAEHQRYLEFYKQFVLPALEIVLLGLLVVKLRLAGLAFRAAGNQLDVYERLRQASLELVPVPRRAAAILATEAGMFYYAYAFFRKPVHGSSYTYHKETALGAVMGAFMLLVLVESFAVHLLLMRWSELAANLLSLASVYSIVYLLALAGAAKHRPHAVTPEGLWIRFGLQETFVPIAQIRSVEKLRGEVPEGKEIARLGLLGNFNLILQVTEPQRLQGLYGLSRQFTTLAFWADDSQAFLNAYAAAAEHGNK